MRLDEYLAKNQLTEEEFGAKAGLSQTTINRIKRGERNPSWETLKKIVRATGGKVRADDFLSEAAA